jgi:hypothetical protein
MKPRLEGDERDACYFWSHVCSMQEVLLPSGRKKKKKKKGVEKEKKF